MTVPEPYLSVTDDLARHSRVFVGTIRVPHHQLRNFISTVFENKLYFVHAYDIFVIDVEKQRQSLVATVPFEARCLAAAHGWICVGGELKGDCAFVRVGEDEAHISSFGLDLVVDMLGQEIVNSMTIHKIPARSSSQQDEIVVLISNNDKSVTLYSLSQQEVLSVMRHPVPMNYATMSPDCTIIAAVGDSHEVFFYQRQDPEDGYGTKSDARDYTEYTWPKLCMPTIPSGKGVSDDYSFAVAFSPSGNLCAVSAQGGTISIFDIEHLKKNSTRAEESIICTFKSSRSSLWGCVRSMAFSPEPWDLLAWTEDHGRIGIADVRRAFTRRQCLSLDSKMSQNIELAMTNVNEYADLDVKERLKRQHLQRMRALRGHTPVGARSLDSTQRQQIRREAESYYGRGLDLDERERSVLEALETTMDDVEHYSLRPYSVNYTSAPTVRPSASTSGHSREHEVELLNPSTQTRSSHTAPQRRGSVILSEPTANRHLQPPPLRGVMTASPAPMSDDSTPPMSTNDLTPFSGPTSQPMPYNIIPPSDPWHVFEAALATEHTRTVTPIRDASATLVQIDSAISAERRLSDRLERQLADERRLSALLRTELEVRERLVDVRHQFLQSDPQQDIEARLSPSLERVLQQQLLSERDAGRERSNELESDIRSNSLRIERLINERADLISRSARARSATGSTMTSPSPGLPSTVSIPPQTHISRSDNLASDLEATLRQLEQDRHAHRLRISDFDGQVRRALAHVESVSSRPDRNQAETSMERLLGARFLSAVSAGSAGTLRRGSDNASVEPPIGLTRHSQISNAVLNRARRAELSMNADRHDRSNSVAGNIPSTSELAGRVSDADMRITMLMMQRASRDGNGNWMGSGGTRGARNPSRSALIASGASLLHGGNIDEIMRDSGVGTAGIGWSRDGRHLYAGTESGIFEFKVSTRDRMCFPAWGPDEMR